MLLKRLVFLLQRDLYRTGGRIEYLGWYTHRIVISNSRIISVDKETVKFKVRDNKNEGMAKSLKLKGTEFVRRFLMHVLPKGFVKVRYFGVMASRNKKTKLALCKKHTASLMYQPKYEGLSSIEVLNKLLNRDVRICPGCERKLKYFPIMPEP